MLRTFFYGSVRVFVWSITNLIKSEVPEQSKMKPVRRGRPRREESLHKIYVAESTFQQWNDRKTEFGMEKETNNGFALFLLNLLMDSTTGVNVVGLRRLIKAKMERQWVSNTNILL